MEREENVCENAFTRIYMFNGRLFIFSLVFLRFRENFPRRNISILCFCLCLFLSQSLSVFFSLLFILALGCCCCCCFFSIFFLFTLSICSSCKTRSRIARCERLNVFVLVYTCECVNACACRYDTNKDELRIRQRKLTLFDSLLPYSSVCSCICF